MPLLELFGLEFSKYALAISLLASFFGLLFGIRVSKQIAGLDHRQAVVMGLLLAMIIFYFAYQLWLVGIILLIAILVLFILINTIVPTAPYYGYLRRR